MSFLFREPESVDCMSLSGYQTFPPGFVEFRRGRFSDGTPYREAAMLPASHGAIVYWSPSFAAPPGWRVVSKEWRYGAPATLITADSSWLFWRSFFLTREWLRRRLYWLGWAILHLGCWCAAIKPRGDYVTLAGAFDEARESLGGRTR